MTIPHFIKLSLKELGDSRKAPKKTTAMEMSLWRRCCKLNIRDKVRNTNIRVRMKVPQPISENIERKQREWYEHLIRMEEDGIPQKLLKWVPTERRKRGRPRKGWQDGVTKV